MRPAHMKGEEALQATGSAEEAQEGAKYQTADQNTTR